MASTRKRPLPIVRVFVSSTFSDLKHERTALRTTLRPLRKTAGGAWFTRPWLDENMLTSDGR